MGGLLLLLAAAAALTGCFEDPVAESLQIELADDGSAWIDLEIDFRGQSMTSEESPFSQRIAARRDALLGGWDEWSARFAALRPTHETHSWIKSFDSLTSFNRSARVAEAAELSDFFADTGIGAFAERGDGWASFALYPGRPAGAGREQVRMVEETVDLWSARIAGYLAATAAVYDYLDRHPERARVCFAHYFEDLLSEATPGPLSAEEEELLTALVETSAELLVVFDVPDDEAMTLNELSRRVFDPFPADVSVKVPGALLEVEGFAVADGTSLLIPGVGLWPALTSLENEWVAPDPALTWVRAETSGDTAAFSLDAFVALPRLTGPLPDEDQVEEAIRAHLEPAPAYRVVWAAG